MEMEFCEFQTRKQLTPRYKRGAGGALIGSAYGGPWGAAGGALIGAGFVSGEYIYNGAQYIWNEALWQISNFENAIKSGWYPGR